jgi:hypothetical protein
MAAYGGKNGALEYAVLLMADKVFLIRAHRPHYRSRAGLIFVRRLTILAGC